LFITQRIESPLLSALSEYVVLLVPTFAPFFPLIRRSRSAIGRVAVNVTLVPAQIAPDGAGSNADTCRYIRIHFIVMVAEEAGLPETQIRIACHYATNRVSMLSALSEYVALLFPHLLHFFFH